LARFSRISGTLSALSQKNASLIFDRMCQVWNSNFDQKVFSNKLMFFFLQTHLLDSDLRIKTDFWCISHLKGHKFMANKLSFSQAELWLFQHFYLNLNHDLSKHFNICTSDLRYLTFCFCFWVLVWVVIAFDFKQTFDNILWKKNWGKKR